MIFRLWHPDFPQYGFKLLQADWDIEDQINRLGPVKLVSGTYDWPDKYYAFRGWTDKLNSLWWPTGADNFSTCVLLIDDARNDKLVQLIEAQKGNLQNWKWPYIILSANMCPNRGLVDGTTDLYRYPAESFPQGGQGPVTVETPRVEWKLYPLQPINLTSITGSATYRGLWLLPLVDIRYFYRNVPLNAVEDYYSASSCSETPGYPFLYIDHNSTPKWMPPLLSYPQDAVGPANFFPISGNGTWDGINPTMRWGQAAELQSRMENWRIVNRDVRSKYSIPGGGPNPHDQFTGVISDYPEDWSLSQPESYHLDACNYRDEAKARLAGGLCDVRSMDELTAKKLQIIFKIRGSDVFVSVTTVALVDYPLTLSHIGVDQNGPTKEESKIIPLVVLGVDAPDRQLDTVEKSQLETAARQWALLYYFWRNVQAYMVFPDIYPLIPNGHAKIIRWDFSGDEQTWRTTYIAVEGVQGTDQTYCVKREPFYARIDGEGALQDNLHGVYAYTELLDKDGKLSIHPNPRIGYVYNVNGRTETYNPARDETGKVAVPVGLVVWMKPGVPYLDVVTCKIFDHYLFTTTDLLQVVRLKPNMEVNKYGHVGGIIQRWNPDIKRMVDSKDVWLLILE